MIREKPQTKLLLCLSKNRIYSLNHSNLEQKNRKMCHNDI